jgi:hypothetical protein
MKISIFFKKIYGENGRNLCRSRIFREAEAGAEIFYKLDPEPHKNGTAPQHWLKYHQDPSLYYRYILSTLAVNYLKKNETVKLKSLLKKNNNDTAHQQSSLYYIKFVKMTNILIFYA